MIRNIFNIIPLSKEKYITWGNDAFLQAQKAEKT